MEHERLAARCRELVKTYRTDSGEVRALDRVSADFPAAAVTAVVGPSGSGKSSLLRIIAGLDRPNAGSVQVEAVDVGTVNRRALRRLLRNLVGYVFQSPAENFVSYLTVMEHLQLAGRRSGATSDEATALLEKLGIGRRAGHLPRELSGGEQQRAAFAQVLVGGASLVVADEPTAELDVKSSEGLLDTVRALAGDGTAFVLATHHAQVAEIAHHTVTMEHGRAGTDAVMGGEAS